jgi:hypothetical protein
MVDVVIYLGVCTHLNRMLRRRYPEGWQAQGCPTFWNNSPANGIRFFKYFVIGSEFKNLGDGRLNLYVTIMRILFALGTACFFGMIVCGSVIGR